MSKKPHRWTKIDAWAFVVAWVLLMVAGNWLFDLAYDSSFEHQSWPVRLVQDVLASFIGYGPGFIWKHVKAARKKEEIYQLQGAIVIFCFLGATSFQRIYATAFSLLAAVVLGVIFEWVVDLGRFK